MSKTKVDSTGIDLSDTFAFTGTTTGVTSLSTASGSAASYSARAWVSFNGTGTVAIRGSGNVSSVADNGTGIFTVNFATNMADVNYAVAGSSGGNSGRMLGLEGTYSVSATSVRVLDFNGNLADNVNNGFVVFR